MRNMKKILSFLLALSMVLSYVPMPALAAEGDPCTVTEGCEGTYNAEGICTVCNLAQLVVTEGAEECQHSGGTATCTALATCDACGEPYGELAAHSGGEATCKAQAVCAVCTTAYGELAAHSYESGVCAGCGDVCAHAEYAEGKCIVCGNPEPDEPEECQHTGGTATCQEQAICEKCETAYGELAAHNYGTDADGKCDACGADCPHAEYAEGKCKVCGMDEPVQEPAVLIITAWNWVDEYEILSEDGTYATLPNAADWETLKAVLPVSITAMVDGVEVEIPVQWECETFPTEGVGQGTYELKAILPEGYALGESVAALTLEVDMGVADQLDDPTVVDTSWHNTTSNSFTLTTAAQLAGLAQLVNDGTDSFSGDTISLGGNLDLSGYANWTPIGKNSSYSFKGNFDGSGCTISNLTIDSNQQYVGLFGYISNGTIKNVVLEKPNVTTSYSSANASVGALVGYHSDTGNIEYCGVRGGFVSAPNSTCANTYSGLGGVVGCHNTSSGEVIGCYNYMTTVSTNGNTMTRCGGVAGSVKNMAKSCYTYNKNQKGIPVVGGGASGNAVYTASFSAYLKADGTNSSSISWNSYSVALSEEEFANGTAAYYLRIGAYSESNSVSYLWGQDVEGDTKDLMPVWNGNAVYQMQWVKDVNGTGTVITGYVNALETKEIEGVTYRIIYDAYDWVLFANLVNSSGSNYANRGWNAIVEPAGATIDFSVLGTLAYHSGSWQKVVTIGNQNGKYNGIFNGNGCTVTGLTYSGSGNYALFDYTDTGAYISDITVKNANISTTGKSNYAVFVRENGGTLKNCHAINATVSAPNGYAGGIAYSNRGTIEKCSFSGSVTSGGNAGGIASSAYSGAQFLECWNSGAVSGKTTSTSYGNYAGGILAQEVDGVTIDNCYNTGNITGYYAGGIVGSRYSNYTTTITNCHSYGATLTGTTTYPIANESMTNCYYLADSETDKVNGTTFKTAAEFKDGTVLNLLNGGNTETVWYQYVDYPILEQKEIPHQHSWTYHADDATDTITAECANTDNKCTVNSAELKMTAPADLVYDGNPKEPIVTQNPANSFAGYTITYTGNTTNGKPVNVGYYTATLTLGDAEISISYSITKAAPSVNQEPNGKTLSFTGNAQELVNAGTATGGTFHYKLGDNGTWSAEIPTATNAGTYKIYWKVVGDANHSDLDEEKYVTTTINAINMTGISAPDVAVTYDGNEHTITVSGAPADAAIAYSTDGINYSNVTPVKKNVSDSGKVYYKVTAPNYNDYTGDATVTIQPRPVTVSGIAAKGKFYDGTTAAELDYANVQFEGKVDGDTLTVTAEGAFADKNVGTDKTVNITVLTLDGASANNYELATTGQQTTATTAITAMNITVEITPNGGTYGGTITAASAQVKESTPDTVAVTLTYTGTANDGTEVNGTAVPEFAGTYTVTATVADTNYNLTGTNTADFVVAKAAVEVPTITNKEFNGTTQTADVTATERYDVTENDGGLAIGDYEVKLTLKDSDNYKWTDSEEATKTLIFKITSGVLKDSEVALEADLTYHGEAQEPTITVMDGGVTLTKDTDYTVSYEKVNEDATATPINGASVDAGTYNAVITGKGSYGGEVRKSFKIKPNTNITVEPETLDAVTYTGAEIEPTVTVKGVKPTALEKDKDYTVAYENNINAGTAKVIITGIGNYAGAKKELTFTINAKELKQENVSLSDTVLGYNGNVQKPEVTVKDGDKVLEEGESKDYVATISYNGYQVAEPKEMGIYTVTVTGKGNYSGSVSQTYVITDDGTDPTIEGVTNGKTYYTTQKAIAKDTNLVSVTKNGTEISPAVPAGTEVTLEGNCTATYTVIAEDIAERKASVTISMKPISTLDDTIENLNVDNVKLSDKDTIQAVLDKVNPIRKDECGNATQAETDALDAIIKKCNDLLKVITDVEDAISKIQAMPDPEKTEPDDKKAVETYNAAKKAYDSLSEHGKELVGTENKAKLDAMLKALTAYDIIHQSSKSYVKGSGKKLSFTANGYYGKFTGIEVDGKTVNPKHYKAESGSTIITLKSSYLDNLSTGKHTIKVNYTDGSTDGKDYFRISVNNGNPFTGDDSHMMLFSGIMMTSLLCMAMMIMFYPRKKGKYQR